MNYDTIKLLNLEDVNIDLNKSHVDNVNGNLVCTIVLNNTTTSCKECGSINIIVKDYYVKKITHSISTNQPCILNYKARRFRCKDYGKTFQDIILFVKKMKSDLYTPLLKY